MAVSEFDPACLKLCPYCRKAAQMFRTGAKGHTLRQRSDTKEWVHDFKDGNQLSHVYCLATPIRDSNGR